MPPEAGFSFSGISVTNASVVSMSAEIEAAFCSAVRVSFGRIDDASLQQVLVFAGSYVEPFIPAAFLDYLDDQSAFLASVVRELPCLEIDSVPTAATVPPCGFSFTVSGMMIVGGRIKTSQWGSNQNQPLFSFKPVGDVLARG